MKKALISVVMGSDSDLPIVNETLEVLKKFGVNYETKILSAHRTPDDVAGYAKGLGKRNVKAVIAFAGGAAHLAGVIASNTILPVIGVPVETKSLKGLDSLLSVVQMPAGIPVATMAIGKAGARNAAILAVEILGLSDKGLSRRILSLKKDMAKEVRLKNNRLKL